MTERDARTIRSLSVEPGDLGGHTVEELCDYLDAGRAPSDPSIDQSPGCQIALDALERLRALTPALLAADTAAEPETDQRWVRKILDSIALDAHAGRRIPLANAVPRTDLGVTEGAIRGLIRAAESVIPGVLVGACRFDGDVTTPGERVRVLVEASVPYGDSIPDLAHRLREEIRARLRAHTTMNVSGIDITVHDVRHRGSRREQQR